MLGPLELELLIVSIARAANAPNHWAISPAPNVFVFLIAKYGGSLHRAFGMKIHVLFAPFLPSLLGGRRESWNFSSHLEICLGGAEVKDGGLGSPVTVSLQSFFCVRTSHWSTLAAMLSQRFVANKC